MTHVKKYCKTFLKAYCTNKNLRKRSHCNKINWSATTILIPYSIMFRIVLKILCQMHFARLKGGLFFNCSISINNCSWRKFFCVILVISIIFYFVNILKIHFLTAYPMRHWMKNFVVRFFKSTKLKINLNGWFILIKHGR